jgi:hypothetical protein
MEIAPVPRRRSWPLRTRLLVVAVALAPITLLVVLPALLGLQRYVIEHDAMGGTFARGSIVYERAVPVGDLEVGDVITFPAPVGSGRSGLLTHRIVALGDGYARTQGDANSRPDPWQVPLTGATQERVVFHLPWVGYPFLWTLGRLIWGLLLAVPLLLLAAGRATESVRRRHVHHEPHLL